MGRENILIIEDDREIQEMLKYAFAQEGWKLQEARTAEEGFNFLSKKEMDCIILDINLPGMDGFKALKKIRSDSKYQAIPIIMCTARGEEADIVTGLELGADDYVVKPYSPRVLAARIRAGLRRREKEALAEDGSSQSKNIFQCGKLKVDVEKHSAFINGEPIELFAVEFAILVHFISHPDMVFSRQKLITAIRGPDYPVTDRSVDVQILGLRKKLKECGNMIETIRSVGYRFRTSGEPVI